ncbi:MAG: transporter substrate-binding domain-containing protein [Microvirga sp.]|jgi:polar amino acid transport system substrate-binding protein|uniref:Transporter substrate-binding domain-containing protein n=1 Tax=Microvirga tunisiensis TaxID=2108360 RepID=A0A5N7MMT8_9HYPH|nr:transporter substrate-binding domain-containing protein [Microvirga tunisiensis]MPR07005.1 transporter substrate-binding domain-containing protein [Microvirga tunisiensis]MPR25296.1 transporter substrate-binding domain-containing protein [Microvirga tunisiensis]
MGAGSRAREYQLMLRDIITLIARFPSKIKLPAHIWALSALLLLPSLAQAQGVAIPNFWDPKAQLDRPDLPATRTIRFLVDDDFPPLHFPGLDGNPTGLSVELARAACERLGITCTIQVRRFDMLLDALNERQGDVVAAAIPVTADLRRRFAVTAPYFKIPARFAVRKDRNQPTPEARAFQGKTIGVVGGTAHEAFAKAFVTGATLKPYAELAAAQAALKAGEIDYLFADGLGLALWIGGEEAGGCCDFSGGPYLESRFFGEGIGFITRAEDENLRRALDFALQQLWKEGKYAELYLRFFPISPF